MLRYVAGERSQPSAATGVRGLYLTPTLLCAPALAGRSQACAHLVRVQPEQRPARYRRQPNAARDTPSGDPACPDCTASITPDDENPLPIGAFVLSIGAHP